MRKLSLLAGAVALAIGCGGAASSAFAAGCLTNQEQLPPMSLTHDAMIDGAGFGYDKGAYDAELAKGNSCAVTQQSQPVSAPLTHKQLRRHSTTG
jgi:hypothetical protein